MRKLFSLIAAVLFAGSMMAETVTLKVEDYAATEFTGSGISVSTAKNDGGTAPVYNTTGKDLRVYAKGSVTISAQQNISAISFVISTQGKRRLAPLTANVGNVAVAGDPDYTAVWTGSATSVTITVGEKADYGTDGNSKAGQLDFTAIEVTLGEGGGDQPGGDTTVVPVDTTSVVPVVTDPTNCAEAAAAALSVSKNNEEYNGGKSYTIQGYVTEIAFAYDATKGNMSFWMADTKDGGKVLEAYKCTITSEENAPAVGDKVAVTGKLTKYNTTPEFATGCTVVIIEKAGGDTPGGDTTIVVTDPTNCAEAREAALSVSKNNELYNGGKEYTIEGYVTAIQTAFNPTYKQVSFWMADTENGGNVLQAYRAVCETAADAPAVGDKVAVTGKLTKYNKTPEFAQGCTYVITQKTTNLPVNLGPKTIAEFLELKNTIDTCVLTGVIANVVSTKYGNFDLVEGTDTLYIYGLKDATGVNCFESEGLEEGDTLTIKAVYYEYNNAPQAKNAIFVEVKKAGSVTPGAEVEITIADGSFSDYVESSGYWMVEAQNADYYISLSNYDLEITQAAGTYTAADLDPEYSYILTETDSISFVSGSIVLAVDAEGVATVTGSLVGNDGNTYILNIACPAPGEYEYDDDSDFIRNFSSYTVDTQYLSEYGDIYVEASDADGYQIVLDLYVPTGASGLVAGTYEINNTYAAGTVASGLYYEGIYPSYAGIATTEGLTNVWYLVSGTVVVDANLNITVNAVNSLGHTIKVTLSAASQTGIEETLAAGKAAKVVRNGQVRILKADKTFDVTGARIR